MHPAAPAPDAAPVALATTRLRFWAQRHLAPGRVFLFGSRARGTAHYGSDFDLAWQPAPGSPRHAAAAFRAAVEDDSAIAYKVDLVNLAEADPALAHRVATEGIPW